MLPFLEKRSWNKLSSLSFYLLVLFTLFTLGNCGASYHLTDEEKNDPDKLLDKGRKYYADDEMEYAIRVFRLVIKTFPTRTYSASWAQYEIGMTYYILKEFKKARVAFVKVLQSYPIPKQPRILSLKLIRKIDRKDTHKRSSYR